MINRAIPFVNLFYYHPFKIHISSLSFFNDGKLDSLKHSVLPNFCNF